MSDLKLNIPHKLSQEEALSRIKNLLSNLKNEQSNVISDVKENWADNIGNFSFSAKGFDLSGNIVVNPSDVEINSKLPLAVSFFKSAISDVINKKAKEILER